MERLRTEADEVEKRLRNKDTEIAGVQQERSYFTKRAEELSADKERVTGKNKEIDATVASAKEEIEQAKGTIASLDERLSAFSKELSGLRTARDGLTEKVRTAERKRAEKEAGIERITVQIAALDEKEKALAAALEGLRVQAAGIETDLSLKEIEDGLAEAKKSVEGMGAVNMLAIEEYEKTCARAKERKERKEILSRERASILERIEQYEKMKHSAFSTAFTAIDGNFRETFARLDPGERTPGPRERGGSLCRRAHLRRPAPGQEGPPPLVPLGRGEVPHHPRLHFLHPEVPPRPLLCPRRDRHVPGRVQRRADREHGEGVSANAQFVIVSLRKPMIDRADRIVGVTLREDKSSLVTGVKASG